MKQDIVMYKSSPTLHFFSGAIAFVIYLLMLLIVIGGFHIYKEQIKYGETDTSEFIEEAMKQESIELNEVIQAPIIKQAQTKEPTLLQPTTQETQSSQPQQKATKAPTEKTKEINLANVFSVVSSETQKQKKQREEEALQQELLLRKKQLEEEQKARAAQLAQSAAAIQQSTIALQQTAQTLQQNVKQALKKISLEKPKIAGNSQDQKKYDEWFAKIEKLLLSEWAKSPKFYQTTTAKVRIRIDSNGQLKYLHMVIQSPYGEYNNSVISFLKNMETRVFPAPPDNFVDMNLELKVD